MTRDEYLQILRDNLSTMTDDERDDVIRYYLEYFIDSGNEQAAMQELGSPQQLAARLCGTKNTAQCEDETQGEEAARDRTDFFAGGGFYEGTEYSTSSKKKKPVWLIVLLVCTFPIWLPVVIGVGAVAFSLAIADATIVFAIFVAFCALAVAGVVCLVMGVAAFAKSFADGLVVVGAGLLAIGIGIFALLLGRLMVKGIRGLFRFIKGL